MAAYRADYAAYYQTYATTDSPALRDSNPSVVVIPALGVFGFARDKREARITSEFFLNAIHVMAGANALGSDAREAGDGPVPQARRPDQAGGFTSFHNYVALPRGEAFRKLQKRVMKIDQSLDRSARRYEAVYKAVVTGSNPAAAST